MIRNSINLQSIARGTVLVAMLFTSASLTYAIAPAAQVYLENAVSIMEKNFVRRDRVDWKALRTKVFETAKDAETPKDTYLAINQALEIMGEQHSFFLTPQQSATAGSGNKVGAGIAEYNGQFVVVRVYANSPAQLADIRVGDTIVSVNEKPFDLVLWRNSDLTDFKLVVRRRGEVMDRIVMLKVGTRYSTNVVPTAVRLEGNVGLLELPTHSGDGTIVGVGDYAERAQAAIQSVDSIATCGWIVDLRRNSGGNMWPMIAGMGPILGEGQAGGFVDAESSSMWSYENGKASIDNYTEHEVASPYMLKNPNPLVAVLTSKYTGSSGEATALSFVGRPNTRSFGQATYGVPTANSIFPFSDNALLVLTVAFMTDRNGKAFDAPIPPDQSVPMDWVNIESKDDKVVNVALEWLRSQPACQK
jgi:carboxyl-terminal processing protease